jgi:hypothetical protein
LYGNLVASFNIGYAIGIIYHGGINIRGSSASHPNDPKGKLSGHPPNGSLSIKFPQGEFLSYLPSGGWYMN